MSRRESTPETQRKRSLSFGEDSSAEKRARRNDESAMRRDASREGSAGPSIVSLASSAGSHPPRRAVESNRGPNEPPLKSRQDYSTPPSSSPVSSASEQSPPRQESRRQAESSSSQRAARPTWQTAEPDRLDERWERRRDRERERERDDRDYDRDDRDRDDRSRDDRSRGGDSIERDHRDRELRAGSTASRAVTPSGFSLGAGLNAPPAKTQAAFVGKLYSMLEDEKITKSGLLYWSQDGTSFVCPNPTEFSKEVLPNYFKHNNWQSFVRQLNMYSFNKVSDLYSTANSDPQAWEFKHSLFQRGKPNLLTMIKRKSTRQPQPEGHSLMGSPGDDLDRPIAGWSASQSLHHSYRYRSPSRGAEYSRSFYTPGPRPVSRGYDSMISRSPPRGAPVPSGLGGRPLSSHLSYADSRSEPSYYPAPQPGASRQSALEAISTQVASLTETVHRMWASLQTERYEFASRSLDMTNHMLRLTDWLGETSKVRFPADTLNRQRAELIQRIEMLQALEVMGPPETSHDDRRLGSSYETSVPSRSMQSALHDPRQVHTSHYHPASPPPSHLPERVRPSTEAGYGGSPRTYPAHRQSSTVEFRFRPPTADDRMSYRDHPRASSSRGREAEPRGEDKPDAFDLDASKTSLRNLLH